MPHGLLGSTSLGNLYLGKANGTSYHLVDHTDASEAYKTLELNSNLMQHKSFGQDCVGTTMIWKTSKASSGSVIFQHPNQPHLNLLEFTDKLYKNL